MDEKSRQVLEAALSLPEDQRASLVEALLGRSRPGRTIGTTTNWPRNWIVAWRSAGNPSSTVSWTDLKARG